MQEEQIWLCFSFAKQWMWVLGKREGSGEGSWWWLVQTAQWGRKPLCSVPNVPLQDDEEVSEFALDGLKQVMAIKSRVVLPYLVPKVNPNAWPPHSGSGAIAMSSSLGPL